MSADLGGRLAALEWRTLAADLDSDGVAVTPPLLDDTERRQLIDCYRRDDAFRSTIVMARHGFGRGEYRYFDRPLPALVQTLRESLYARLAPVANHWAERLSSPERFPSRHGEFLERCGNAGQKRATPLLLRYGPGDYNCLHQDLYGEVWFPLQAVFLLSAPGTDFAGGELVLTEQRPRAQSRAHVVSLQAGAAALFAVRDRPRPSRTGHSRVRMRHGVATVTRGSRYTLGIVFHDAA